MLHTRTYDGITDANENIEKKNVWQKCTREIEKIVRVVVAKNLYKAEEEGKGNNGEEERRPSQHGPAGLDRCACEGKG